jgi:uncharacterized RDD family membrane protein YckC
MSAASPAAYAAQPGTMGIPYARPFYAGFWLRLVAHLLDGLIVGVPMSVIFAVIFFGFGGVAWIHSHIPSHLETEPDATQVFEIIRGLLGFYALLILVGVAISWLYYALMESSERQATLGKAVLNLKVTDMSGNQISFGRASGRYFSKIVSGFVPLGIGYIMAGFTERKQALHDFMGGTLVVRSN